MAKKKRRVFRTHEEWLTLAREAAEAVRSGSHPSEHAFLKARGISQSMFRRAMKSHGIKRQAKVRLGSKLRAGRFVEFVPAATDPNGHIRVEVPGGGVISVGSRNVDGLCTVLSALASVGRVKA